MTNYDKNEIALSETIDFIAFLKMNCIRIPPSAYIRKGCRKASFSYVHRGFERKALFIWFRRFVSQRYSPALFPTGSRNDHDFVYGIKLPFMRSNIFGMVKSFMVQHFGTYTVLLFIMVAFYR